MSNLIQEHLYALGCDFAFDVYLFIASPRTGKVVSAKLRETLETFLTILLKLKSGAHECKTLLRAAQSLLERLSVYIEIAADFIQLQTSKRDTLLRHQQGLKFVIRSLEQYDPRKQLNRLAS